MRSMGMETEPSDLRVLPSVPTPHLLLLPFIWSQYLLGTYCVDVNENKNRRQPTERQQWERRRLFTEEACPQGRRYRCKRTLQGRGLQGSQREEGRVSLMTHGKKQNQDPAWRQVLERLGEQMHGKWGLWTVTCGIPGGSSQNSRPFPLKSK